MQRAAKSKPLRSRPRDEIILNARWHIQAKADNLKRGEVKYDPDSGCGARLQPSSAGRLKHDQRHSGNGTLCAN
jgi:hypothetical protein